MRLPTVTLVLGGGHSIGVPLAVCGKETFIAHTASMTIHPVRMSGTVIAAPGDIPLLRADTGAHREVCGGPQPHQRGPFPPS